MNVEDVMGNEHVKERGMVERFRVVSRARAQRRRHADAGKDIGVKAEVKAEAEEWDLDVPRVAPILECETKTMWAGPDLGQHNEDVLRGELGLGEDEMKRLSKEGIIGDSM